MVNMLQFLKLLMVHGLQFLQALELPKPSALPTRKNFLSGYWFHKHIGQETTS